MRSENTEDSESRSDDTKDSEMADLNLTDVEREKWVNILSQAKAGAYGKPTWTNNFWVQLACEFNKEANGFPRPRSAKQLCKFTADLEDKVKAMSAEAREANQKLVDIFCRCEKCQLIPDYPADLVGIETIPQAEAVSSNSRISGPHNEDRSEKYARLISPILKDLNDAELAYVSMRTGFSQKVSVCLLEKMNNDQRLLVVRAQMAEDYRRFWANSQFVNSFMNFNSWAIVRGADIMF